MTAYATLWDNASASALQFALVLSKLRRGWPLVGLALLGLVLRFWGAGFGSPHLYHPDEPKLVQHAVRLLDFAHLSRDAFFQNQVYPTITTYLQAIALFVRGIVGLLGDFSPSRSLAQTLQENPFSLYYTARIVSILCGTATLFVTHRLANLVFGRRVAWIAVLFLAVAPLHVKDSHFATADIPTALFSTLALLAVLRILTDSTRRALYLAAFWAAVAAATKYQAGVIAIPLALAILLRHRAQTPERAVVLSVRDCALAGLFSLAVFLILVPFPVFDAINHFGWGAPFKVPGQLAFIVRTEAEGKVGILRGEGWFPLLTGRVYEGFGFTYPNDLPRGLGIGVAASAVVTLLASLVFAVRRGLLRSSPPLVLAAFPVLVILLIERMQYQAVRHLLPAVPALVIFAAKGVDSAASLGARLLRRPHLASTLLMCLCAALVSEALIRTGRANLHLAQKDTRTIGLEWLERRFPRGARVALEFYGPPVRKSRAPSAAADGHPRFSVHDTSILRFFGGPDRREKTDPRRAVARFRPEMVVLDSWSGHRFYLPSAKRLHPQLSSQRRDFYAWVERDFREIHKIVGSEATRPGPTLRFFVPRAQDQPADVL